MNIVVQLWWTKYRICGKDLKIFHGWVPKNDVSITVVPVIVETDYAIDAGTQNVQQPLQVLLIGKQKIAQIERYVENFLMIMSTVILDQGKHHILSSDNLVLMQALDEETCIIRTGLT